jgi:hypothetical protein
MVQKLTPMPVLKNQTFNTPKNNVKPIPRDKGLLLWSDNFSSAATWVFTNSSIPAIDWSIETNPNLMPAAGMSPFSSTTATNGFLFISSDGIGGGDQNGTPTIVVATTATPIDLTGQPDVNLSFQQNYRWWQDTRTLRVSGNNGTTWTDFEITNGQGSPTPQQTPLVEQLTFDISAVAGGQSQVLIQFVYNDNDYWAWYWAVDDVEIRVKDDNDLVAKNAWYGFNAVPYSRVPINQIQAVDFSMEVDNFGALAQTQTQLTVDVNSGTFTGTSLPVTVPVGGSDSLFLTTQYTPASVVGAHNITMTVASSATDASPSNNTITPPPFEITANKYAMDRFTIEGNAGGLSPTNGAEFEAGNYFEIVTTTIATGIEVIVGTTTAAGTTIDLVLYEDDGTSFNEIDRSAFYVTTAADQGNSVILPLPTTPTVNAGSLYFVAVHALAEFRYGVSGTSPDNNSPFIFGATSLIYYPTMTNPATNEAFYTTATPMVRLILNSAIGVKELSSNTTFTVFPNPSNGIFNINLDAKSTEVVNLTVNNIVGQTVLTKRVTASGKTTETISLANFDKGIYFLTIDNNNEKQTVKLIVE